MVVTDPRIQNAMVGCSVGMSSEQKNAVDAELKSKGMKITYDDTKNLVTGVLKDSRPEDRIALVDRYMACFSQQTGIQAEKKSGSPQP